MHNLVYSVGEVFSEGPRSGVLGQKGAEKYYIPPYQRGYKWKTSDVVKLVDNLYTAYSKNQPDYYLNYITIRPNKKDGSEVLEVVDGQQRLTTLTLLLAVLAYQSEDPSAFCARNKLTYQIRKQVEEFIAEYIYANIGHLLQETNWKAFAKKDNSKFDEQDIYYLFHAAHAIEQELSLKELKGEDLLDYTEYVLQNTKIIVNDIGETSITAEKMFTKLNGNKVDLTDTELTKGLLLTKASLETDSIGKIRHPSEVARERFSLGAQWDEMARWTESESVRMFYFSEDSKDPMLGLLKLLALSEDQERDSSQPIFEFFENKINEGHTATAVFRKLREIYFILKMWLDDTEIYNLLGFRKIITSTKTEKFNTKKLYYSKSAVKKILMRSILMLLPKKIEAFEYGKDNVRIGDLFLFINVFSSEKPFPFSVYQKEKWSLEHVFPQTPDKLSDELNQDDLTLIKSLRKVEWKEEIKSSFNEFYEEEKKLQQVIDDFLRKFESNEEKIPLDYIEKQVIYRIIKTKLLHTLGNLVLLSSSVNSAVGNGMFDHKRHKIVAKVSEGNFVPQHTYDVFSKLLSKEMEPNLRVWSDSDIRAHQKWIDKRYLEIRKRFSYGK